MSSINKAFILGNLGADPEVRETEGGTSVANFSIATNKKYNNAAGELVEKTEWHRCVAWGRQAEILRDYTKKGDQVHIEGELQTREYEDKEGVKRWSTEIKVLPMGLTLIGGSASQSDDGEKRSTRSSTGRRSTGKTAASETNGEEKGTRRRRKTGKKPAFTE